MGIEILPGKYSNITMVRADTVEKVTRELLTPYRASRYAALLERYVGELEDEPINVAPVYEIAVVPLGGLAVVRHTMGIIDGAKDGCLSHDQLREPVAKIVEAIAAMSTSRTTDGKRLRVPVDAQPRNFVEDTLIDVYPPLSRNARGRMAYFSGGPPDEVDYKERYMGTPAGAITHFLLKAVEQDPEQKLQSDEVRRDWCMDMLPAGLGSDTKREVGQLLRHRLQIM